MDLKEIKQIVDLMKRSSLTEFEIEEKDLKLRICRQAEGAAHSASAAPAAHAPASMPHPAPAVAPASAPGPSAADPEEAKLHVVKSPMVGTFYRAPSPDSKPFVDIGTKIKNESTVCIIEAMKVMNEIQAEVVGTVADILVENGESVEYGQPLFKVKKA